jgi:hypothetical protein
VKAEAKSAGGETDADDVSHMKAVATQLKKIGVTPYLVFSKAADSFSPTELDLFRAAESEGYSVILFTNKEMEPYNRTTKEMTRTNCPTSTSTRLMRWSGTALTVT